MDGIPLESYYSSLNSISTISTLLSAIAKMAQKPSIESDLSQVLDEFLDKLQESDVYLENGIVNMNFAEAALLIQSSADMYCKKVDLLWDIFFDYQRRMLDSEQSANKQQEIEKLEERKRKYKRKRKANESETLTTKLVNIFSFGSADNTDYLNQTHDQNDLTAQWSKIAIAGASSPSHQAPKNPMFIPNNSIYTEDNEYIGRYDQFHSGSLVDDIFYLEREKLLIDEDNCVVEMRIDSEAINDFLLEKKIPSNKSPELYADELRKYIAEFRTQQLELNRNRNVSNECVSRVALPGLSPCSVGLEPLPPDLVGSNDRKEDAFVNIERLPNRVVQAKLRRFSTADSLFEDDRISFASDLAPFDPARTSETRNKSCSQDSAFFDMSDHDLDDVRNLTPFSTPKPIHEDACKEIQEACSKEMQEETSSVNLDHEYCARAEVVSRTSSRIIKRKLPFDFVKLLLDEKVKKLKATVVKRVMSRKRLEKLATGVTVHLREFEKFFRQQYQLGEHEDGMRPDLSDSDESDVEKHESSDEEEEDEEEEEPTHEEPEPEDEDLEQDQDETPAPLPSQTPGTTPLTPEAAHAQAPPPPQFQPPKQLSVVDLAAEEASRKNVKEWRSFILPKLKQLENRSDFDIHEYGQQIIGPTKIGEQRSFDSVVEGKSSSEVARFFIATLQLANTSNIEIVGAKSGEVANETFEIKTLDKTRHYELLEEYQAPSEESFRERLERVKAMNPKLPMHSTPFGWRPPKKKARYSKSSKKLF